MAGDCQKRQQSQHRGEEKKGTGVDARGREVQKISEQGIYKWL